MEVSAIIDVEVVNSLNKAGTVENSVAMVCDLMVAPLSTSHFIHKALSQPASFRQAGIATLRAPNQPDKSTMERFESRSHGLKSPGLMVEKPHLSWSKSTGLMVEKRDRDFNLTMVNFSG